MLEVSAKGRLSHIQTGLHMERRETCLDEASRAVSLGIYSITAEILRALQQKSVPTNLTSLQAKKIQKLEEEVCPCRLY